MAANLNHVLVANVHCLGLFLCHAMLSGSWILQPPRDISPGPGEYDVHRRTSGEGPAYSLGGRYAEPRAPDSPGPGESSCTHV